jgi:tetratricopeptide (TPR) repeat protein
MGLAYTMLNEKVNFEEVIKAYKKAIEINPDNYETYNNMGGAYAGLDKFEEAIEAYEKAIEIEPNNYDAYYTMGLSYTKLRD